MSWTDKDIEHLRKYWAEGHSTAEIGRLIGKSKNAVVGKAHRLSLPSRPSPIKKSAVAPKPVEQPKASETVVDPLTVEVQAASVVEASPKPEAKSTEVPIALQRAPLQMKTRAKDPLCQWPYGHPDDPDFRFCLREAAPGKPYCAEHCSIAYIPANRKGEAREAERRAQLMAQEGQKIGWASERSAAPKKAGDPPYIPRMFTAALDEEFHQIAQQDLAEQRVKK